MDPIQELILQLLASRSQGRGGMGMGGPADPGNEPAYDMAGMTRPRIEGIPGALPQHGGQGMGRRQNRGQVRPMNQSQTMSPMLAALRSRIGG